MRAVSEPEAASSDLKPWFEFLHLHAAVTRELDRELERNHRLTLHGYELLRTLARAPAQRLRMSDLASGMLLTPSGITRLVAVLERSGLVERTGCREDARVTYAHLTDEGALRLVEASETYLLAVRRYFLERLPPGELSQLARLLGHLTAASLARTRRETGAQIR